MKTITRDSMVKRFAYAWFNIESNGGRALKHALSLDDRYIKNTIVMGMNLNINSNDDPDLEIEEYIVEFANSKGKYIGVRRKLANGEYKTLKLNPWIPEDLN